jgi:adenine/guanine phosphoribosyltransferase-like PRPP-binding protein/uncharacterized HAD superfamily protein
MSLDKCDCPISSTYCNNLNRMMTPSLVKFCKSHPSSRSKLYKEPVIFSEDKVTSHQFKKVSDIPIDCINNLIPKIANANIKCIVGVPRSGMVVASICAVLLNKPLYTLSSCGNTLIKCSSSTSSGGKRMKSHSEVQGKILFIDDTCYTGKEIRRVRKKYPNNKYACLYCTPESKKFVDFYGLELARPHYLEWHFFNSYFTETAMFDLDGIFCPDVPDDICEDEKLYVDFISTVEPIDFRIPRSNMCMSIVTARLEKYRAITETWLKNNNIRYNQLYMYPFDKSFRDASFIKNVSKYKGDIFLKSRAKIFIESDDLLAKKISVYTQGKTVVCPNSGEIYYAR